MDTEPVQARPANPENSAWVDEALAPFSAFVADLAVTSEMLEDQEVGLRMFIDTLRVDLPWEMDVLVDDQDRVQLAGAPPTQYTETSILPVFHRLSMNITIQANHG